MQNKTIPLIGIPLKTYYPLFKALGKIKGLGETRINLVLNRAKLRKTRLLGNLQSKELLRLSNVLNYFRLIKKWKLFIKLNRTVHKNIQLLKSIKCFRGLRHQFRLPCRGQRTRSNAKTSRFYTSKMYLPLN